MELIILFLSLVCLILIGAVIYLMKKNHLFHTENQSQLHQIFVEHQETIKQMQIDFEEEKQRVKKVALTGSRNTIKGTMSEKFCPFQDNFAYSPADCSFLGKPIDFIIFNNIEKYRDHEGDVSLDDIEIVFLEVKTGKSSLTKVEKAIQYAIENKRVRFETYRYQDNQPVQNTLSPSVAYNTEPTDTVLSPLDFTQNDVHCRTESKQAHVLKSRETFPRSSYKWSGYEEDLLIRKYDEGYNLTELTQLFQRTEGGISSRLKNLGVDIQLDE